MFFLSTAPEEFVGGGLWIVGTHVGSFFGFFFGVLIVQFPPVLGFKVHFAGGGFGFGSELQLRKGYSGIVVAGSGEQTGLELDLIKEINFVSRLGLFDRQEFFLFIELLEGFD